MPINRWLKAPHISVVAPFAIRGEIAFTSRNNLGILFAYSCGNPDGSFFINLHLNVS